MRRPPFPVGHSARHRGSREAPNSAIFVSLRRPHNIELYSPRLRRTLLLHYSDSGRIHAMIFIGRRRDDAVPVANAIALGEAEAAIHPRDASTASWLQMGSAMFDLDPDEPQRVSMWLAAR